MTTTTRRKPRYFYGWNIVAAAFIAHLTYSEHLSSVLGLFFKPLGKEFGWTRTAMAAVQSIGRLVEAVTAPIVGPWIDRYGARVLMPIGAVILGAAMLATTQVHTLWQFYLVRGVIAAIGFTLVGGMVITVTINNWFVRKRGRALAIGGIGSSLGNIIIIPVAVFVIAAAGWRTMFVVFAVMTWLLVIIPSIVLMRRRPEDMGLYPDNIEPAAAEAVADQKKKPGAPVTVVAGAPEPIWNRREVLSTVTLWILSISLGIDSMAFQGINISLAPYVQDLGYQETMMASILTYRFALMAAAGLVSGFLAEYAYKPLIRVYPFVFQSLGAFLFLFAKEPVFLWLAVTVYALGTPGIIQEVLWANYYGRLSLGLVRSLGFLVSFGFGAAGPIVMNAVFDILGSYRPAFIALCGLFLVAAFLIWIVRPPKPRRYATAAEIEASYKQHR